MKRKFLHSNDNLRPITYRDRPIFTFYLRPHLPLFCLVSHLLSLAIANQAFVNIDRAEDIWVIKVPSHRHGVRAVVPDNRTIKRCSKAIGEYANLCRKLHLILDNTTNGLIKIWRGSKTGP